MSKKQNPPKIFIILTSALLLTIALLLGPATVSADGPTTYTYDNAGRLVGVDYGDGASISYTYDDAGNMLSRKVAVEGRDRYIYLPLVMRAAEEL